MKTEHLLITGATGAFGKYLLKELAQTNIQITALVRAKDDKAASARIAELGIDEQSLRHIKVLRGDLVNTDLGLKKQDYIGLQQSVTSILHAAASTRFDLPLSEAQISNVGTLQNVLGFAAGANRLDKFGYVSTAFVAGKMTGLIPEAELSSDAGFVNTYDQTKFEAEKLIRASMHSIPTAIYRPSLIVAPDSNAHHAAVIVLKLIKKNLLPILPGRPDDLVDLIAADKASKAISGLFLDNFRAGETYHIVSGNDAPSLASIVALSQTPGTKITYTGHNSKANDNAVQELIAEHPALEPIYNKIDCFIKYLCYPKVFASTNATDALNQLDGSDSVGAILKQLAKDD